MKVYVCGPMRGLPEFNFPAFKYATEQLRDLGHEVFNPAERDLATGFEPTGMTGFEDLSEHGFNLRKALAADMAYISRKADALALLPGWETSSGAKAEIALADALGLPVLRIETWMANSPTAKWELDLLSVSAPITTIPAEAHISDSEIYASGGIATGEVRSVSSTGAEKGTKLARFDLIPAESLAELATHYGRGSLKYADNNWRKGYEWSKSYAALCRHLNAFWGGEDIDPETGTPHIIAVAWHAFTLHTFMQEHPDFDDRWARV